MMQCPQSNRRTSTLEVLRLPDVVRADVSPTGLVRRFYERRKAFYDDQQEELHKTLKKIALNTKNAILDTLRQIDDKARTSNKKLENAVLICDPRVTADISLNSFINAHQAICDEIVTGKSDIEAACKELEIKEEKRQDLISAAFNTAAPKMMALSHVPAEEVSLGLKQDMVIINQVVLKNRRTHVDLSQQSMTTALYKERQYLEILKLNEREWKEREIQSVLIQVANQLNNISPPKESMETVVSEVVGQISVLQEIKRMALQEVVRLTPPLVTGDRCRDWLIRTKKAAAELYTTIIDGIERVKNLYDKYFLILSSWITSIARELPAKLSITEWDVDCQFKQPSWHMLAEKEAQLENDFQYYAHQLALLRDTEATVLEDIFAFLHGAVWQWEVHLTSLAHAEDFLDALLQKQRVAMQTQMDSCATKLRTQFEALRCSSTPAVTNAQQHAILFTGIELRLLLNETWKKTQKLLGTFPVLVDVLSRGYSQRIFSYMQVSQQIHRVSGQHVNQPVDKDDISKNATVCAQDPRTDAPQIAPTSHSRADSGQSHENRASLAGRHPPDITQDDHLRKIIHEFGLTTLDEENLGIRLKCLTPFLDDPRQPPPQTLVTTATGVILYPSPTSLHDCLRFAKEHIYDARKPSQDPPPVVLMTESQTDVVKELFFEPLPEKTGFLQLDDLLQKLPSIETIQAGSKVITEQLRETFLCHVADIWDGALKQQIHSLLDTKKEMFEMETQLRIRCCALRLGILQIKTINTRNKEVKEHEKSYKALETAIAHAAAGFKTELVNVSKIITDHVFPFKENLALIEKELPNATRISHVQALKSGMKDEIGQYMGFVRKKLVQFRNNLKQKCQKLSQDCRNASGLVKKFADGGTYNPDEFRHYDQLMHKLIDKVNSTERTESEEARIIEQRRRLFIESLINKTLEKMSGHEVDMDMIHRLTLLLGEAQSNIKDQAAVINTRFLTVQKQLLLPKDIVLLLQINVTTGGVDLQNVVREFTVALNEMHDCCLQLGCLYQPISANGDVNGNSQANPQHALGPSSNASLPFVGTARTWRSRHDLARGSEAVIGRGFRASKCESKTVPVPSDIPTDFQLVAIDGPVPLAPPNPFAPVDVKMNVLLKGVLSTVIGTSPPEHPSGQFSPRGSVNTQSAASNALRRKQKRVEKYLIFGEAPVTDPKTFLEVVHTTCWHTLLDAINLTEKHYRTRGNRLSTRPDLLPNTFELIGERICRKLLNYLSQSEMFAIHTMKKANEMSKQATELIGQLGELLLRRLLILFVQEMTLKRQLLRNSFRERFSLIRDATQGLDGEISIPVNVRRENNVGEMLKIMAEETLSDWSTSVKAIALDFVQNFGSLTDDLFKCCDLLLMSNDFRVPGTPFVTIARASRDSAMPGILINFAPEGPVLPKEPFIWKPLYLDPWNFADDIVGVSQSVAFSCIQTTEAHNVIEEARQMIFKQFLVCNEQFCSEMGNFVRASKPSDPMECREQDDFEQLQLKRLEILDKMIIERFPVVI